MKSTNLLVKRLIESGMELTDNVYEAMYILADGRMISGEYNYGMRGQDHRAIFCGTDYDRYDSDCWDRLHKEYKVVRLVPETNYALIRVRQRLTPEQMEILEETSYEIERY